MTESIPIAVISFAAGLALLLLGIIQSVFPHISVRMRAGCDVAGVVIPAAGVAWIFDWRQGLACAAIVACAILAIRFPRSIIPFRSVFSRRWQPSRVLVQLMGGLVLMIAAVTLHETVVKAGFEESELAMDGTTENSRAYEGVKVGEGVTDAGRKIALLAHAEGGLPVVKNSSDSRQPQFRDGLIRMSPDDDTCNCHGWVFTGGRYWLSPDDVEVILVDNGYQTVVDPLPGDLVIYRTGQKISHTALVKAVLPKWGVLVEGKWGYRGVFAHRVDTSGYGKSFIYYRSSRAGHVISGMAELTPQSHQER